MLFYSSDCQYSLVWLRKELNAMVLLPEEGSEPSIYLPPASRPRHRKRGEERICCVWLCKLQNTIGCAGWLVDVLVLFKILSC
uniref:Uncharacterized protein n=1 Tax=Aegilops tauschii subsp. strangulata TaxID=200361 RepID=A0A453MMA0_AEGTS